MAALGNPRLFISRGVMREDCGELPIESEIVILHRYWHGPEDRTDQWVGHLRGSYLSSGDCDGIRIDVCCHAPATEPFTNGSRRYATEWVQDQVLRRLRS